MKQAMKRTWKPIVAGILNVGLGIGFLTWIIYGFGAPDSGAYFLFLWLPFAIAGLIAGICALRRKIWWLAVVGSAIALAAGLPSMFISWVLTAPAIILLIMSRREFA